MKSFVKNRKPSSRRWTRAIRWVIALGFGGLLALGQASAQQWSTAGNGTDIYATNTNANVGVGTNAPTQKLTLFNGHLLFSNAYGLLASGGAAFKTGSGGATWGAYPG